MSTSQYCRYPFSADVMRYPSFSDFVTLVATNGAMALAMDTSKLYAYSTSLPGWVEIGGATPGGETAAFNVYQNTPQTVLANGTRQQVIFDTVNFDDGNFYSTSTGRYTPLISGNYLIFANILLAQPTSAVAYARVEIFKNNGPSPIASCGWDVLPTTSVTFVPLVPPLTTVQMNGTTDYLTVYISLSGNSGTSLQTIAFPYLTYFGGLLANQVGSPSVNPIIPRQLVYSTRGSDADGNGSWVAPFASPLGALTAALALSPAPSLASPVVLYGDPGTYSISNSQMIYPNIYYAGPATWTAGTASSITLAPSASWSASLSAVKLEDITLDSTLALTLDTTGITNFNSNIYFQGSFNSQGNTTFKFGSSSHQGNFYLEGGNVILAGGTAKSCTIDGISLIASPGHQIALAGTGVSVLATNNNCDITSTGNAGIGDVSITTNATHSISLSAYAGQPVPCTSINATGAAGVQLQFDWTTCSQQLNAFITGSNYSFTNISAVNNLVQSDLTDGATVTWDPNLSPSALWILGGNHTLANPTNVDFGQIYTLCIQQNATGGFTPVFSSSFVFPYGIPFIDTRANAFTVMDFYCADGSHLICTRSRLLESSTITAAGVGAAALLNSGSTQNATIYGEAAGATLPSAPANVSNSTLIGYQAGTAITTSGAANDGHTAVGHQALATTSTSKGNTAVGFQALQLLTTAPNNTAIGWGAGVQLTSGTGQNVLVGVFAGSGGVGQTIANNVFIGYHAGWNTSTAATNVVIGSSAAPTLSSGSSNIVIGGSADVSTGAATGQIVIGQGITGLGNHIAVIGDSSQTNLVNAGTTGNCALGSTANPFGFLYLGSASNYVGIDPSTQTVNGQTIAIPDSGSQPQSFLLGSVTAAGTSQTAAKWVTYLANSVSQVVFTLPSFNQGDRFQVIGQNTGGWKVAQPAGVSIKLNANLSTTVGTSGFLASTDQYDSVKLIAESSTVLVVEFVKGVLKTDTGAAFNAINTNNPFTLVTVSGTTKTLGLSDGGSFQVCSNAATQTVTIPTNASIPFVTGTKIEFVQQGVGQLVFSASGGVTIQSKASNLKVAAQYSGATLVYLGSDTWSLIGDLTA